MLRFITLVIGSVLALLCCAQGQTCRVPAECYAILHQEASKAMPDANEVGWMRIEPSDVERAECILTEFISWHKGLSGHGRDSLMEVSDGRIRNACMSRDWRTFYRQYRGYLQGSNKIIRVNLLCRKPGEFGNSTLDLTMEWYEVDDGGDCYFQAAIDLTKGEVIGFSVNGPVDPNWCR